MDASAAAITSPGTDRPQEPAADADIAALAMERSPRMDDRGADPVAGRVVWAPAKSLFYLTMAAGALIGGPLTATPGAVGLFLVTTAVTICLGHSLGMHRLLIHRAFAAPRWLERLFVYLGTLVGMAGPFRMIWQHDIRDWGQRRSACHPFLAHRSPLLTDGWQQLNCDLTLDRPPRLIIEPEAANDAFYRFLDRHPMAQQLPWALLFYAVGGWPFVIWGVCVRVFLSLTGHWLVGYYAHHEGRRTWLVADSGVQGSNVPFVSLLTMGESLHNNHHAFPGSARLAHGGGEIDPGWWVLRILERFGLVWNVRTPETLPMRHNLVRIGRGGVVGEVGLEPTKA
jgi:fatty-acid desaturase